MSSLDENVKTTMVAPTRTTASLLGVLMVVLGVLSIVFSYAATFVLTVLMGALLLAVGLIQLFDAFSRRTAGDTALEFFVGVISIVAGALILASPAIGILSLTVVLGVFFAVDGLSRFYFAFQPASQSRRTWLMLGGVLSLILAALILFGLPGSASFTIGLLFGIYALFLGFSVFVIGRSVSRAIEREA